jgi:hypothetical protein
VHRRRSTEFNKVWLIDRARFSLASELPLPRRQAGIVLNERIDIR